mmetsp:Transcript_25505/g.35545  ORF Transcript_25505/g.35545 Transcript_25505/m.35545 type:complete len:238 (+) Transcript_25505:103-816(+)
MLGRSPLNLSDLAYLSPLIRRRERQLCIYIFIVLNIAESLSKSSEFGISRVWVPGCVIAGEALFQISLRVPMSCLARSSAPPPLFFISMIICLYFGSFSVSSRSQLSSIFTCFWICGDVWMISRACAIFFATSGSFIIPSICDVKDGSFIIADILAKYAGSLRRSNPFFTISSFVRIFFIMSGFRNNSFTLSANPGCRTLSSMLRSFHALLTASFPPFSSKPVLPPRPPPLPIPSFS